MYRSRLRFLPFLVILLIAAACDQKEITLSVTPTSSTIVAGTAPVTLKASQTNTSGEVSWTLSPNLGTLSSTTGLEVTYTPPATVAAATVVTLTASLGNFTAKATLTINPVVATGFTVTGKVQGYNAGAASLEAVAKESVPSFKVGEIEADGTFSITLPDVLEDKDITLETDSPCSEVTQTAASFKTAQLSSLSIVKDNLRIGEVSHASSLELFGSNRVTYVYVDRDVSITGTCREERDGDSFNYIYDTNFKKGWNLGLTTFGETSFSFTTPESVDLPWLFSPSSPKDTTPPTTVSVDPPDGAKGVNEDASIVITFSEKMDRFATEDAFQRSANFPGAGVTYSWNAEDTVLTVKPNDLLDYAAGEDPSIKAITYTFGFVDSAKDVAGNALAAFDSSFSTLRVISSAIYATANLDGNCYGSYGCLTNEKTLPVGDLGNAPTDGSYRSFLSFDVTGIPASVIADEARIMIYKEEANFTSPNPYPLGDMSLEHVNYGGSLADDYNTPILADLGIFDSASQPATGYLSSDVTSALNDDLANRATRGNRSQYRLRFPVENNNNGSDFVSFTSGDGPEGKRPFLTIVYYIP